MKQTWDISGKEESAGTDEFGFTSSVLTGGKSAGVQMVQLRCGDMRVLVLPTRGMSIYQVQFADGKGTYGWNSPIPDPVHPMWVPIAEPSGLGWLDGFNEMLVRCGLESNGAPQHDQQGQLQYPLHGRIGNLPASGCSVEMDDDAGEIRLTGIVEESRFHFRRTWLTTTMTLHSSSPNQVQIRDEVENKSNRPSDFQLLYHINIGQPILEAGAEFVAPYSMVCPRNEHAASGMEKWTEYLESDPKFQEQVYFMKLAGDSDNRTKALLHNANKSMGFSVGFQTDQLPFFSLWKNTVGKNDGYVTGLEPAVNFPNRRSYEEKHGRVVPLASAESKTFDLTLGFQRSESAVNSVLEEIENLTPNSPTIHESPVDEFCEP